MVRALPVGHAIRTGVPRPPVMADAGALPKKIEIDNILFRINTV
jgi:hypothetical protein